MQLRADVVHMIQSQLRIVCGIDFLLFLVALTILRRMKIVHAHDPPTAEDRLTGVMGGTNNTAKSESHIHNHPPAEDSMWNRLTGILGGTDDSAKSKSRSYMYMIHPLLRIACRTDLPEFW